MFGLMNKISASQKISCLISAYLDPVSHKYLEKDEIELVETEFEKFYPLPTGRRNLHFAGFWSTHGILFPKLSKLVRKYNIKCATSVQSESAFSISGYIQRQNRMRLSIFKFWSIKMKKKNVLNCSK
ncbi:hypothetical protein BpHYR1_033653 [Brachionus plicatilis]|uniref:HAT C-terminal dimerisation domain-containing protein n=1 Tax=Brachionus plicatilis TaxID=10195 RepID=A0A3M7PYF2_BRAPC|nr:hypothetical protein BpHYR1_033653 [Brachionus plicatilis]